MHGRDTRYSTTVQYCTLPPIETQTSGHHRDPSDSTDNGIPQHKLYSIYLRSRMKGGDWQMRTRPLDMSLWLLRSLNQGVCGVVTPFDHDGRGKDYGREKDYGRGKDYGGGKEIWDRMETDDGRERL